MECKIESMFGIDTSITDNKTAIEIISKDYSRKGCAYQSHNIKMFQVPLDRIAPIETSSREYQETVVNIFKKISGKLYRDIKPC